MKYFNHITGIFHARLICSQKLLAFASRKTYGKARWQSWDGPRSRACKTIQHSALRIAVSSFHISSSREQPHAEWQTVYHASLRLGIWIGIWIPVDKSSWINQPHFEVEHNRRETKANKVWGHAETVASCVFGRPWLENLQVVACETLVDTISTYPSLQTFRAKTRFIDIHRFIDETLRFKSCAAWCGRHPMA